MRGWRATTHHTGIHFGADAVYAVGLTRRRGRLSLTHCSAAALEKAPRLPEDLADEDARRGLAGALRQLRDLGLPRGRPYLPLGGAATFLRRRPVLPGAEAPSRDHLRWEAGQLLGDDLDDYVVDYLVTRRHGFVAAAHRELLARWNALCEESGVDAPGFDMASFALCHALEGSRPSAAEGVDLIVHGEARQARAVLLHEGEYEAERVLPADGRGGEGLAGPLKEMLEEELGEEPPRALWLSGPEGPVHAEGLAGLADSVAVLDPFSGLDRRPEASRGLERSGRPPGAFAVAAGLAYRSTLQA